MTEEGEEIGQKMSVDDDKWGARKEKSNAVLWNTQLIEKSNQQSKKYMPQSFGLQDRLFL